MSKSYLLQVKTGCHLHLVHGIFSEQHLFPYGIVFCYQARSLHYVSCTYIGVVLRQDTGTSQQAPRTYLYI